MSATQSQGTLYLVDAYALIFQVFHAIGEMTSPRGLPTNALFGFARDMLYLHEDKKPDFLVCVFDGEQKTFRDAIASDYKANRSAMPDSLRLQIGPIQQLCAAMRIPIALQEGYEADDLIATAAVRGEAKGLEVFICSSDKDCRQLLTDAIKIYNLRKQTLLDCEELLKLWGVRPEQVIDFQTLVGDSVDNVKGVAGIGEKTAAKLLQQYGTLDNLLANVEQLKGKQRENLKAAIPKLETTRQLVRLETNVPMEIDWDAWRWQRFDAPRLLELFRDWGFHSFANQVRAIAGEANPATAATARPRRRKTATTAAAEDSLFAGEATLEETATAVAVLEAEVPVEEPAQPPGRNWAADYRLVDTAAKFKPFLEELRQQSRIAFDIETKGKTKKEEALEPRRAQIVGLSFSWKEGEAYYLPMRGPAGSAVLDEAETLAQLRPVLEDVKIEKVNQNIKFDLLVLRQQGVAVRGVAGDPMVADYLLNPAERGRDKASLAQKYLRLPVTPIEHLIGKNGPKQKQMDEVPTDQVAQYAGQDADIAARLTRVIETELVQKDQSEQPGFKSYLYDQLEIPLIDVLAELEFNGIRLNIPLLRELDEKLGSQITSIEKQIHDLAGEEFNIASLKQLRRVLFEKLKYPTGRKTRTTGEFSTDQQTLEELAARGFPIPKLLLQHRHLSKLKGAYTDALPNLVNPDTGRVHASFNQTVAATGRLSSSDPNLQHIPIRTDLGGQIRQAFVPEAGWVLLTADYSQIELRLLAHFSGDEALQRAFREDRDIHTLVGAQIYSVPEDQVTTEMRRMAKTVNFGVIYGMSAHGLAQRLQLERSKAEEFINAYFARYPKVLDYQQELLRKCRERGFVATILGRRRPFDATAIRSDSTYQQRNITEREAINMEIQGSAADLMKEAMLAVHRRLQQEKRQSRMLLQIHDELVFEAPPDELPEVARLVSVEMIGALASRLTVPLKVDVSAGPNWLDVEALLL